MSRTWPASQAAASNLHEQIIENLSDGVYFVNRDREIEYWNRGANRITGYTPDEVVGRHCYDNILNHVDDAGRVLCYSRCPLVAAMEDGQVHEATIFLRHREGHRLPVRMRAAPIRDENGEIIGASEVFADATGAQDTRREMDELKRLAFVDELTGLGNRRHTEGILAAHLDSLARHGWAFGILVADIDHFKEINDRHGHAVGDVALRIVGRTIVNANRSEDFVGRWGGDEFVIVVAGADPAGLQAAADRIRALVARSRVRHDGVDLPIAISLGGAMARPDDTIQALFTRADQALYGAKAAGRDRVLVWSADAAEPVSVFDENESRRSNRGPDRSLARSA